MPLLKRISYLIIILLGAVLIVHTLVFLIPGDPAVILAGEYADQGDIENIRKELSLDASFWSRYLTYIKNLLTLNMGNSIYSGLPVSETILDRFPATLLLACASMALACIIGILLGIAGAIFKERFLDNIILSVSSLFISTPIFVTCFLLTLIFSYCLNILPPSGKMGLNPSYIILPSLALASRSIALIVRITRNELISVMRENYIRTARSLGFPESRVIFVFALKNIIVPVLTVILLDFGAYLGGAVVTESVFSWPGVGRLLIVAVYKRDIPVIQGVILFGTVLFIVIGFIIEIIQGSVDKKSI